MPATSVDICQWLVGVLSGKGLHAWATSLAVLPSSCYHLGLGGSGCLNPAQDQLAFSEGLWDTRSCCGPWSLHTWSELWVRAHDGREENTPCDQGVLVALGGLWVGLVREGGHAR